MTQVRIYCQMSGETLVDKPLGWSKANGSPKTHMQWSLGLDLQVLLDTSQNRYYSSERYVSRSKYR